MAFSAGLWAEDPFQKSQSHVCDGRGALLQVCTSSGRAAVQAEEFFISLPSSDSARRFN